MFSREYLERLGAETGFGPDTLEKVLRLERLLTRIRHHPFLGEQLVLKGGTALNLFFGGPVPRLSVDLDLNYVHAIARDEMLRDKPEVERALRLLVEGDRYRLQWGRDEHAGRTPDPDFPCRAVLAGTEEILAGKVLALLDRGAPRDLYDVASMAGGRFAYDADLFRPLFVALSGVLDRAVTAYAVPHRPTLSQAELEEQLTPVLRRGEHPNQAALTASITPLVSSLVTLSEEEREYVQQIQWGEFHPELVVKNRPELFEQVRRHPGLLWKVENGRRRARR